MYFSPTFSTERVSNLIADEIAALYKEKSNCDVEVVGIDLSIRRKRFLRSITEEGVCILGSPSFAGKVVPVAAERMRELSFHGARVIILTAYGNRAFDDTLVELEDIVKELR